MADTFDYDVFISYSSADKDWVRGELLPRLESKGLRVCIDFRDFKVGAPSVTEIERAIQASRKTILVLTPHYLASAWTEFEALMLQTLDPANRQLRLIPLLKEKRELPLHINYLTYVDFTDPGNLDFAWSRLLNAIKPGLGDAVGIKHASPLQNAPIPRAPFVGFVARRDKDGHDLVEYVGKLLENNGFVILWGAGGIGKTALAAEIARSQKQVIWSSADGRVDFSLGTLLDDIATQFGRADLRTLKLDNKIDHIRDLLAGGHTLVVLDNLETVTDEAQKQIIDYLTIMPCSVLITSRVKVSYGRIISIDAMGETEAREFVSKLIEISPSREVFVGLDILQIIHAGDANPKVIEWIVAQIEEARQPHYVFDEIKQGKGDAARRVFDRSFNLLNDNERVALLALTLFAPSASPDAIAKIVGSTPEQIDNIMRRLVALELVETTQLNSRIRVLGLTREIAGKLRNMDNRNTLWVEKFVAYFVDAAKSQLQLDVEDSNVLEIERENFLAAMELAFATQNYYGVGWIAKVIVGYTRLFGAQEHWLDIVARARELEKKALDFQPPRHLNIFISRTNNHEEDVRRMREVIVLLSAVEGRDRFTFYVPNPQGMVQLDFPNQSTNYYQIQDSLNELIGDWGTLEVQ